MEYSVAMTEYRHRLLASHLIRKDGQEDLCFALYRLGSGENRLTALISEVILPLSGDRQVHGNVSFSADYYDRVSSLALQKQCGVCFLHSHPSAGWQGMSQDDIRAEEMLAPRVKAMTDLPLVGMTIGNDGTWSARFWVKEAPRTYIRYFCATVRVLGKALSMSFYDKLVPSRNFGAEFSRTISAWGSQKQQQISRLKVGIVGLGSVGSIVAEALLKTGINNLTLIDFDTVELKNLDRLQGIGKTSVGKAKVFEIRNRLKSLSIGDDELFINALPYSLAEETGLKAALDCDLLFSCVDRPWPRFLLNCIAYSHLIPVIDGGIDTNQNKRHNNLDQARWKAHVAGPGRRCLCCLGQFVPEDVALEQSGLLEDPNYIQELSKDHFINRGENVFSFSLGLAGLEMQQFLSLNLQPRGQYYGPKEFNFNSGTIDSDFKFECEDDCAYNQMEGLGDQITNGLIASHPAAESKRLLNVNSEILIDNVVKTGLWQYVKRRIKALIKQKNDY